MKCSGTAYRRDESAFVWCCVCIEIVVGSVHLIWNSGFHVLPLEISKGTQGPVSAPLACAILIPTKALKKKLKDIIKPPSPERFTQPSLQ